MVRLNGGRPLKSVVILVTQSVLQGSSANVAPATKVVKPPTTILSILILLPPLLTLTSFLSTTIGLNAHHNNAELPKVETEKAEICEMHKAGAVIAN
jgi:hypothetical protein